MASTDDVFCFAGSFAGCTPPGARTAAGASAGSASIIIERVVFWRWIASPATLSMWEWVGAAVTDIRAAPCHLDGSILWMGTETSPGW